MDQVEQNRLKWKCRRGLLELDIVLERFLRKSSVAEEDAENLRQLLDLPDNDLWDIVIGRSDRYESHLTQIVARLRAA
jgi:succinate dehydrogenase flavin-adding protein (antitoxin of CptAB toxin-antitoxin module)